jgi:hypothetical protein
MLLMSVMHALCSLPRIHGICPWGASLPEDFSPLKGLWIEAEKPGAIASRAKAAGIQEHIHEAQVTLCLASAIGAAGISRAAMGITIRNVSQWDITNAACYGQSMIMDDEFFEWLERTVHDGEYDIVLFDGLSFGLPETVRLGGSSDGVEIPFDLNHRQAAVALVERFTKLAELGKYCTILVHHSNKSGAEGEGLVHGWIHSHAKHGHRSHSGTCSMQGRMHPAARQGSQTRPRCVCKW